MLGLLVAPGALALGCGDDVVNHYYTNSYYNDGGAPPDGAGGKTVLPTPAGGEGGAADAAGGAGGVSGGAGGEGGYGVDNRYPDAPVVDTDLVDFELDIFGTIGNRYWFAVSDEQRLKMNGDNGGVCCFDDGLYHPGASSNANWVDHLFVTTATEPVQTTDYGKVQAKVVGGWSRFPWEATTIPNLNIDADQFVEGQRIAGYEHLRFSNGQRGSIFRDKMAYDLYRMLGYTAPLATWAWVSSNVWGPEVSIPYTLVERYKRTFCDRYADEFGGGCPNMWEYASDFNGGGWGGKGVPIFAAGQSSIFDDPNICQMGTCDPTRVKLLEERLLEPVPEEGGFKGLVSEFIDWPAFHRFQCLAWVLGTSDDTIHGPNNVVLVEGDDGLFRFLPYSIDLSLGSNGVVDLRGYGNAIARRCQDDASCWSDTLDVCEDVVAEFKELKPREYLKELNAQLKAHGMLRPGDDRNYQDIDNYLSNRLDTLSGELEQYRSGEYCQEPYVNCNGSCMLPQECNCNPGPIPGGAGGVPGKDDMGAPPPIPVAGAGNVGVGGTAAIGGGMGVGGGIVGGGGPVCPKNINYAIQPR
ncbi:MAG TPA: hypothetical protein VHP33_38020 [Polyangiaceae bacterium]|nr:hypothetical protein [Polyangiaceae bacterium]